MICYNCKKEIDDTDNYCRFCGKGQGSHVSWYYKLWGVWILLFIIGPFCLWFLYKSSAISKKAKIINAILILIISFLFCYQFYIGVKRISDLYSGLLSGSIF